MMLIAGGFVLGEVLILLHILTVWQIAVHMAVLSALIWFWSLPAAGSNRVHKESRRTRRNLLLFCIFITVGAARGEIGQSRMTASEQLLVSVRDGTVTGQIREISLTGNKLRLILGKAYIAGADMGGSISGILLEVDDQTAVEGLKIGMTVSATGRLREFSEPRNPGEFHARNYYRGLGLCGRLQASDLVITDYRYDRIGDVLYRLRQKGSRIVNQLVKEPEAGIMQAAVLGEKRSLDENIRALYSRNGISHLLALSGLHLSLIISGCYKLLRRSGIGFLAAGIIGAVLAAAYVRMTGSPVSVVRAALMVVVGFLASFCGRKYDLLSALSLAAFLLLIHNPYLVFLSSFQLSFGAILGIGIVFPCLGGSKPKGISQALLLGLSIQAATLPITLFHFYQISLYGIVLNLIVIPLMAFVVASGVAGIVLGAISIPVARFAIGPGFMVLVFYEWLCRKAELLPLSMLITGQPAWWQLLVYAGGLLAWLVFVRCSGNDGCGRKQAAAKVFWLIVLQLFLLFRWPVAGMQVTFLDVGQGDGICIRHGHSVILVDGGSSNVRTLGQYRLEPFLKQQGISVIDYVYISHGDTDHISGIRYLLEEGSDIRIRNLMIPAAGREHPVYWELSALVEKQGGNMHWIGTGDKRQVGKVAISCLFPDQDPLIADANSHSLVLKVTYGAFGLLLTGDMGTTQEEQLLSAPGTAAELADIQVLKVAHHGSRFSTSPAWLAVLSPQWAVISCGEGNSYGHPHEEVLQRLETQEVFLYQTMEAGAIRFHTDGRTIRWSPYLEP